MHVLAMHVWIGDKRMEVLCEWYEQNPEFDDIKHLPKEHANDPFNNDDVAGKLGSDLIQQPTKSKLHLKVWIWLQGEFLAFCQANQRVLVILHDH